MKKIFSSFLLNLFILGSISAQTFIHAVSPKPNDRPLRAVDTLKILAVMVEFQPDNSSNTFGDGTFGSIYSKDYGAEIIDPLPHNAEYFEAHLDFAVDYYKKASDGKLTVAYELLPDIVTVSKDMLGYSPQVNSTDLSPLGDFASEVWQIVENGNSIDFSQFDIFMIFHAGAGRDVSLPGSLGLERDLPSIYLSYHTLKEIFGETFTGFPVNNGSYKITNTAILPETESRELNVIGGTALIELSINGLIVANIASHLGLPDLFDTETGKSAIGRFGLMDGQAIFAYGGLFPPMLSAWEKMYLGWIDVPPLKTSGNISLEASKGVVKIPINANEYYLIENRNRDVKNDGARLTIWQNGTYTEKVFEKDQEGFYSYDISGLHGVVTAVDEYDWALPGSGIVIWHIDEKVIRENLATNTINADKNRRGVDVEEADGIQDIGEEFRTIFGDVIIGEGDSVDLWYSSNPAELYTNRFDKYSKPGTESNEGGNSFVVLSDFSEPGMWMNFSLNFGIDIVSDSKSFPLIGLKRLDALNVYTYNNQSFIFLLNEGVLEQYDVVLGNKTITELTGNFSPAFIEKNDEMLIAIPEENRINILIKDTRQSIPYKFTGTNNFTTPAVWLQDPASGKLNLFAGTEKGYVELYEFIDNPDYQLILERTEQLFDGNAVKHLAVANGYYIAASDNMVKNNFGQEVNFNSAIEKVVLTQTSAGAYLAFVLTFDMQLVRLDENLNVEIIAKGCSEFSIGNLKNDGENYVVYTIEDNLFAASLTGAVVDGFPYSNPLGIPFEGLPITGSFDDDGADDIFIADSLGNVTLINGIKGNAIAPFPISLGSQLLSDMNLFVRDASAENNSIAFITRDEKIIIWALTSAAPGNFSWYTTNGSSTNSNYIPAPLPGNIVKEFFPESEVYNWPNPVYGGDTYIHYYVEEDSDVEINIFDLGGNLIQKLNDFAAGGFDNQSVWNTNGVESGVYFAHVKVTSVSGKSAVKIVKIAVIH